ncbi:TRAP transporter large permease [Marinobacterium rhizophilum]|uniref:TRAP transporter large permease protein n=1 Tax=Marinobacterium rhizophilum TaxID=420402 RepID=A0ABY5HIR5_9GAMM|nr:TRAP transporter large permease [Marinobacterium rhizophilum]UTW11741.1 TRAP transporter large permease [Marinobacterium rhizophilum]
MSISIVFLSFSAMLGLLLLGLPIAVTMALVGMIGGGIAFGWPFLESTGAVVWSVHNENILTAIPLFVLLGELMLRSGIADRMYVAMAAWLGRLPGGLVHTNIGCCALFAATSGSSVATAATIGTVALPTLEERKYSMKQALGSLAAGGTLGILIPPSVNMLIYGSLTNNSIGKLFMAGLVPGILLSLLFMGYIAVTNWGPDGKREETVSLRDKLRLSLNLIPPTVIFGIVMGSIYLGIATATESAALGVMAALFFGWRSGRLNLEFFKNCFVQTARITGMILLIITAAFILNLTISLTGVVDDLTAWVVSFGLSTTGLLLVLILFYLCLGMFMDVLSMQVVTIPITYPIMMAMGVDPIWFGVFIVLMCELGMITPPVGMNLFVVQSVRKDGGNIQEVMWGVLPYMLMMLAFTVALMIFPQIALWLPELMH